MSRDRDNDNGDRNIQKKEVSGQFETKTPREFFGFPECLLLEKRGVQNMFKVGTELDLLKDRAQELGLDMSYFFSNREWGEFFTIGREGETFGQYVSVIQDVDKTGIWIADLDFDRYQDLFEIREGAVGS